MERRFQPVRLKGIDVERMSADEVAELKQLVYRHKVLVLEGCQFKPDELLRVASRLGAVEKYFQPNYHHPEHPEIFVSSNVPMNGKKVGVSGTGRYWHCDYQFFPKPFSFVMVYPVVLPETPRFTHFINMADALRRLPDDLRRTVQHAVAVHDPKFKYKIQASDVDKALDEVMAEVEKLVPPLRRKAVVEHPVTGEMVLFMSPGFTRGLEGLTVEQNAEVMRRLFDVVLQEEWSCDVQWQPGDLLLWDNVSLIHRSSASEVRGHSDSVNFRVTMYDEAPGATPPFLGAP